MFTSIEEPILTKDKLLNSIMTLEVASFGDACLVKHLHISVNITTSNVSWIVSWREHAEDGSIKIVHCSNVETAMERYNSL